MKGQPVVIRYLDPPLDEFVPNAERSGKAYDEEIAALVAATGLKKITILSAIEALHEHNPMMGHRGCRLAVTYPEIAEMQTRAVIEAAINICREGIKIKPEIMIPIVSAKSEFKFVREIVDKVAKEVMTEKNYQLDYSVGTMIEIPRAAITADKIAESAEFFSFGTNDLTQMTFGFSREDSGKFLGAYFDNKVLEFDPFETLDTEGVGELIKIAVAKGKSVRPLIKLGICGEHGGDPDSVKFCHKVGLYYVSCSPFRVPIAILAAAQAAIADLK
jgi:pyruvate,orthophosphate dikinase